jgi:hypothetical protein
MTGQAGCGSPNGNLFSGMAHLHWLNGSWCDIVPGADPVAPMTMVKLAHQLPDQSIDLNVDGCKLQIQLHAPESEAKDRRHGDRGVR